MKTSIIATTLLAALMMAAPAIAETGTYGPVAGVSTPIVSGASSNGSPGFIAAEAFTTVTLDVVDDVWGDTYMSACIDVNGNGFCNADLDGDIVVQGINQVTLTAPSQMPAGTEIITFVYTAHVALDGTVAIATTGTVTATWE